MTQHSIPTTTIRSRFWLVFASAAVALLLVLLFTQVAHAQDAQDAPTPLLSPAAQYPLSTTLPFSPTLATYLPVATRRDGPARPVPANFGMFISLNTNLTWEMDGADGARYDLFFSESYPPDTLLAGDLSVTGYNPPELPMDTRYYWRVVATLPNGQEISGPVWTFKTEWPVTTPSVDAMVTVMGGEFSMGCDKNNPYEHTCSWNDTHYDEPVRRVWVDTFAIDTYEVTNAEYRKCYEAGECNRPRKEEQFNNPAYALAPVTFVSWYDAQDFCRWEGKRLPTEAEWEKAGRGTLDTRVYPWGDEEPDCHRINMRDVMPGCEEGREPGVVRVGSYPTGASPYGVHDMSGNVFEWVQDKYDVWYYLYSPLENPQGPPYSRWWRGFATPGQPPPRDQDGYPVYVLRGGAWAFSLDYVRVSHRHWGHHGDIPGHDIPLHRNGRVGFRCAKGP